MRNKSYRSQRVRIQTKVTRIEVALEIGVYLCSSVVQRHGSGSALNFGPSTVLFGLSAGLMTAWGTRASSLWPIGGRLADGGRELHLVSRRGSTVENRSAGAQEGYPVTGV